MKRIIYIGGGALSLTSSVLLKKRHPELEVFIVEKDSKLGRKLAMTGGGKCNLAPNKNESDVIYGYNNPAYIKRLYEDIPLETYLSLLKEIGIETKTIKEYGYYPVNESAPTLVKILNNNINKLGIRVIHDEFIDFDNTNNEVKVILKNQTLICDKLVLALGGVKEDVLSSHHIDFNKTRPGLCPIKVKENISPIFGSRMEADVTLLLNDKQIYKEHGEVMFKKDALSGICIMNIASVLSRNNSLDGSKIVLDLTSTKNYLPQEKETVEEYFLSICKDLFADYLIKRFKLDKNHIIDSKEKKQYLDYVSKLTFTPSELYDYKDAQVVVGGYSLSNKLNNVYLLGEMNDIDGLCGGYNLRYVISEGFRLVKKFKKFN